MYEKIFCLREKGGEHEGAFPFLLMYCQHLLPSPIMQPVLVLWQVVLLSLKKIFALSAPLTLQVENVFTQRGFNVQNLPLSASPCYRLCRWPLVRLTAIISGAMAYARKYLGSLLGF